MTQALRPNCPRCGRDSNVEELGTTAGSIWLHCNLCGHLWRRLHPERDAFSLILESPSLAVRPILEEWRPDGTPRASRFEVRIEVRYRLEGETEWRTGLTENVSRSGLLFRPETLADPRTPIDIILVLPGAVAGEPTSRLRCRGEVVRAGMHGNGHDSVPCMAAMVTDYQLAN